MRRAAILLARAKARDRINRFGETVSSEKNANVVMLSGAKHLVFSLTRKNKILRLKPQNDIAAQSRKRAEIWWVLVLAFSLLSFAVPARAAADLDEQARQIAGELRCPVCQNLSVADSPSELAQQMRAVIVLQLKEGKTPEQIKAFFVSK